VVVWTLARRVWKLGGLRRGHHWQGVAIRWVWKSWQTHCFGL